MAGFGDSASIGKVDARQAWLVPRCVTAGVGQYYFCSAAEVSTKGACIPGVLDGRLRRLGLGCHVGSYFVGCIVYADDIILLSASVSGLKLMLLQC